MFLISKFAYDAMTKIKYDDESKYIKYIVIHQYAEENHRQTYYKFRYGATDDNGEVGKVTPINLSAGTYASVWSLEGFELSERVLAIFGHSSSLFKRGLELIHSPFIDPSFKGQLQVKALSAEADSLKLSRLQAGLGSYREVVITGTLYHILRLYVLHNDFVCYVA